jgi:hypothetical protein
MNVEIGTEAAQFPEKEYINGISRCIVGCIPIIRYIYIIGTVFPPSLFSSLSGPWDSDFKNPDTILHGRYV